jgi:hypothetical protein
MNARHQKLRLLLAATALAGAAGACTGGVNAGEEGGIAFIIFAGMLLLIIGVLWIVLGRED